MIWDLASKRLSQRHWMGYKESYSCIWMTTGTLHEDHTIDTDLRPINLTADGLALIDSMTLQNADLQLEDRRTCRRYQWNAYVRSHLLRKQPWLPNSPYIPSHPSRRHDLPTRCLRYTGRLHDRVMVEHAALYASPLSMFAFSSTLNHWDYEEGGVCGDYHFSFVEEYALLNFPRFSSDFFLNKQTRHDAGLPNPNNCDEDVYLMSFVEKRAPTFRRQRNCTKSTLTTTVSALAGDLQYNHCIQVIFITQTISSSTLPAPPRLLHPRRPSPNHRVYDTPLLSLSLWHQCSIIRTQRPLSILIWSENGLSLLLQV
ncbi:uncharacterized protein EV420DRAFT_1670237 [Desarmillaria tabescens]|uniref:Uncharacterized protein n=1 Tax=Armillaria tabescens TaxID=1929756 RepID=A0AA39MKE2_ARMTA|nr:uncharacterized protein EV420DRAFT_1670237 [Desarmillaria tabescens]KAK0437103.1 hypothetical protein EV420DRAFT_1670237 [Desarmillaria tabescens]